MQTVKFICWQEQEAWLGCSQDYPNYWTQGKSLKDLKEHLVDLDQDLTSGGSPGIPKVEDLVIA